MAQCVVESCKAKDRELFCAPDDKNKLRKWKQVLKIELNEFLICDIHFLDKFKRKEIYLLQDSFPTLLLNAADYESDENCQSCLKKLESGDIICVDEEFQKLFFEQSNFEIKLHTLVCVSCHEKFTKFDEFLKDVKEKQELKKRQFIKDEPIGMNENSNDTQIYDDEESLTNQHFILENDDTMENPQILRDALSSQDIPKKFLNKQTNVHENSSKTIRDEETTAEQNVSETQVKNASMVVIPDIKFIKQASQMQRPRSKSIYVPSADRKINLSVQHDHGFMANAVSQNKRRNSVASVSDANETLKKRARGMNLPNQTTICSICQLEFVDIMALKLHQETDHKFELRHEKPENFRCADCNESFTSYYFLRKHKDTCNYSLRYKCAQQYCRFRAETVEILNNHVLEVHSNQTICKICKADCETLEELKLHEKTEHGKKRLRKQTIEIKQDIKTRKVRFSDNFDRMESTSKAVNCSQCSQLVAPEMLSVHIKQHMNNTN